MSERTQDQRPVYMGTFSKQIRYFDSKIAEIKESVESIKHTQDEHTVLLKKKRKTEIRLKLGLSLLAITVLAIIMRFISN